jgi:hypothetical protein
VIRTRDGHPVPELVAILAGTREADQLRAAGVELPADRVAELGRAVIEHVPAPDAAELAGLLAQLQDRNQAIRRELETAPELHPDHARDPATGGERGLGEEQTGERGREQRRDPS